MVVLALGLGVICAATLTPGSARDSVTGVCLICGALGGVDAILNVLLFVPFGAGLGLVRMRWWKALLLCLLLTLAIEALQFAVISGRDASLGDALTNSIGGAIGFIIGRFWTDLLWPSQVVRIRLFVVAGAIWAVACLTTAYSLMPRPTVPPYYGQLARQRSTDPAYPGIVSAARLGPVQIPDTRIPNGSEVSAALRAGEPFEVRVTPRESPNWFSPIARIADRDDDEIAVVAAEGNDVVFSVRTNASFLRLRPYMIGVPEALDPAAGPATIVGSFYCATGRLIVSNERRGRESSVAFGLASGWRLILPFTSVATGAVGEALLDVLWFSLLVLPIAFWWTAHAGTRRLVVAGAALAATLMAVTLLIDVAMKLPFLYRDLGGVVVGVAIGSGLGRVFQAPSGYQFRPAGPDESEI
jgi:hypothetical protein